MRLISYIKKNYAKAKGGECFLNYLRNSGITIGDNCRIFSDITTTESYLIRIGNGTTISADVVLITHDASIQKVLPEKTDLFGRICIGNNCFIGSNSIIMYGVTLPDNTIVAAGSVVTKSIPESGKIVGGNPARVIGTVKEFGERYDSKAINIRGLSADEKRKLIENEKILIRK